MELENVVPWGRNLQEYQEMGLLNDADKDKKILGCGDGPASVNSELTQKGVNVVSIDPIYQFSKEQITQRVQETSFVVSEQLRVHSNDFVWKNIKNVDELISLRMGAMDKFLADYENGRQNERYQHQVLPNLNFADREFDLAWSSHFLFLYSEHFNFEFHKKSILEMLRVSKEVRIFPLFDLNNKQSIHLDDILQLLQEKDYSYKIQKSEYEFQKGANQVLKIWH
jgi:hypothetical protein